VHKVSPQWDLTYVLDCNNANQLQFRYQVICSVEIISLPLSFIRCHSPTGGRIEPFGDYDRLEGSVDSDEITGYTKCFEFCNIIFRKT
jgi:hypothetical protein